MTLSPSDVEQKTFSTALRGYDLDEVDDFLDEVVATIRELNEQIAEGPPPPPAPVAPPPEPAPSPEPVPAADESAVGRALVAAQETADKIVADAREEAERILELARSEADDLASAKEQQRAATEAEMAELTEHVAGVRSRLAVLATAVANRLDEMDEAIGSEPGELSDLDESETETGVIGGEEVVDESPVVDAGETVESTDNDDTGESEDEGREGSGPGGSEEGDDEEGHSGGAHEDDSSSGWG
jgi:cell division initiation protein